MDQTKKFYHSNLYNIKTVQSDNCNAITTNRRLCCILAFDPAQNAIQGDAPEGSDTFQWQLGEEIAWAEIG